MAKRNRSQLSVSLGRGREERLRALASQHPYLRYSDSLGSVIGWILDWACRRLWREVRGTRIQKILVDGLGSPGKPWSNKSDLLSVFALESEIDQDSLVAILDGKEPTDNEISGLAMALGMDVDYLIQIVKQQYAISEVEDEQPSLCPECD